MLLRSILIAILALIASQANANSVAVPLVPRGGGARTVAVAAEATVGPLQVFLNTIKESRRHLAAAAVARCVSIYGMFPVGM